MSRIFHVDLCAKKANEFDCKNLIHMEVEFVCVEMD